MTSLSLKLCTALIVAAAVPAMAAAAGPGFPRSEKYFNQLDADKDGKLTLAEIGPRAEKRILRIDQNSDGSVSTEEIEAWLKKGMERRRDLLLADYDGNRDGAISRDELTAFLATEFGRADKDGDGAVSLDESRSYRFVRTPAENDRPEGDEEE